MSAPESAFRCEVWLETNGGKARWFSSRVLSFAEASAECARYLREGHSARVVASALFVPIVLKQRSAR